MKQSTKIKAGELELGTVFQHESIYGNIKTLTVTKIRKTKTGRVAFCVNDSDNEWSHKPISPNSYIVN